VFDAIKRLAAEGKPVNRDNMRDAIHTASVKTLQGTVSFDENGDIKDRTVSVFHYEYNDKYPVDDVIHQYKYLGLAPPTS
jgi:branched-chain amino acid transport system substrate-binding protein